MDTPDTPRSFQPSSLTVESLMQDYSVFLSLVDLMRVYRSPDEDEITDSSLFPVARDLWPFLFERNEYYGLELLARSLAWALSVYELLSPNPDNEVSVSMHPLSNITGYSKSEIRLKIADIVADYYNERPRLHELARRNMGVVSQDGLYNLETKTYMGMWCICIDSYLQEAQFVPDIEEFLKDNT